MSGASGSSGTSGGIGPIGLSGVSGYSGSLGSLFDIENVIMDYGGDAIPVGAKGVIRIGYNAKIVEATLLSENVGSINIDIWKSTYAAYPPSLSGSIVGPTDLLSLTNAISYTDTALTGWNTTINAGDILRFYVSSNSGVSRLTVALKLQRT